jgi:hypothetical protein
MTRIELLASLVRQARKNGFEFRKWYTTRLHMPWHGFVPAITSLLEHRSYYALLFSHEFARSIWKPGSEITFVVPESFFRRRSTKDGTMIEVRRKPYTRRAGRPDVWKYHLQQLALADDPLRYMRKYVITAEHLTPQTIAQLEEELAQSNQESNQESMNGSLSLAAEAEPPKDSQPPPQPPPAKPGRKRLAL